MMLHGTLSLPASVLPAATRCACRSQRLGAQVRLQPGGGAGGARARRRHPAPALGPARRAAATRPALSGRRAAERARHLLGGLRRADLAASRAAVRDARRPAPRLRAHRPGAALRLLARAARAPRLRLPRAPGAPDRALASGDLPMRLKDKVAVVVGAGQTPERRSAMAARPPSCSREKALAWCWSIAISNPRTETRAHDRSRRRECFAVRADVTREEDCRAFVRAAVEAHGRVDVLHNNVGIGGGDDEILSSAKRPGTGS